MKYDAQDFAQNPKKYQLFKTAVIDKNIFTHNGENDLREGEIVGIKYLRTAWNSLYKRDEPVYTVTRTHSKDGNFVFGHVYANALRNFVL